METDNPKKVYNTIHAECPYRSTAPQENSKEEYQKRAFIITESDFVLFEAKYNDGKVEVDIDLLPLSK